MFIETVKKVAFVPLVIFVIENGASCISIAEYVANIEVDLILTPKRINSEKTCRLMADPTQLIPRCLPSALHSLKIIYLCLDTLRNKWHPVLHDYTYSEQL